MTLTKGFIITILIVTAILGGVSLLMWKTARPLLPKNRVIRILLGFFLSAMTVGIPYNIWVVRLFPVSEKGIFSELTHIWLGVIFYFIIYFSFFMVFLKIAHYLVGKQPIQAEQIKSRRQFLSRSFGGLVGTLSAATSGNSYLRARQGPEVVRVDVALKRLPATMQGLKIAQISDLHVGPLIGRDYVQDVVDKTMQCQPDLIVLTGDFVDGSVAALSDDIEPLQALKAPLGVFFVSGNHEFYSGCAAWLEKFRQMGIRVLENEHVVIEKAGDSFYLLGIHDPTAQKFGMKSDVAAAIAACEKDRLKILLAHQPKSIFEAEHFDIDLQLSGHTHAGQMWPLGLIASRFNPYLQGLHRHSASLQIYVNRGTGFWGPPMRSPWTSEITEFTLFRP